jgi:RNA-directed DNA polymerase
MTTPSGGSERSERGGTSAHAQGRIDFRAHLIGQVAWARQVNPAKAARLERDLARIDWQR